MVYSKYRCKAKHLYSTLFRKGAAMMKSNTFQMSLLFDFYGELLTEKQRELFDLYYNEDLSLAEIADHAGISRQGVRDAIVRSEGLLRGAEERLGFVRRYAGYETKLDQIGEAAQYIQQVNVQLRNFEVAKQVDRILALLKEIR